MTLDLCMSLFVETNMFTWPPDSVEEISLEFNLEKDHEDHCQFSEYNEYEYEKTKRQQIITTPCNVIDKHLIYL